MLALRAAFIVARPLYAGGFSFDLNRTGEIAKCRVRLFFV
jgi:hypothetical protein